MLLSQIGAATEAELQHPTRKITTPAGLFSVPLSQWYKNRIFYLLTVSKEHAFYCSINPLIFSNQWMAVTKYAGPHWLCASHFPLTGQHIAISFGTMSECECVCVPLHILASVNLSSCVFFAVAPTLLRLLLLLSLCLCSSVVVGPKSCYFFRSLIFTTSN